MSQWTDLVRKGVVWFVLLVGALMMALAIPSPMNRTEGAVVGTIGFFIFAAGAHWATADRTYAWRDAARHRLASAVYGERDRFEDRGGRTEEEAEKHRIQEILDRADDFKKSQEILRRAADPFDPGVSEL